MFDKMKICFCFSFLSKAKSKQPILDVLERWQKYQLR